MSYPKGHTPWTKGKPRPKEVKEAISKANKGRTPWNKGRKLSKKHVENLRKAHLGYKQTEEHRKKRSLSLKGKFSGAKSWSWRGGKSLQEYPITFDNQLRDKIRTRHNFKCALCGVPELECKNRLSVHHIDYDKKNCDEKNLTCLCTSCHIKTNHNREYWKIYFSTSVEGEVTI